MSSRCAYCDTEFLKKTHNQKYCNEECCRKATNERIMRRYYEKRDNRRGRERVCANKSCNIKLSRYNEDDSCSRCGRYLRSESSKIINMFG